MLTMKWPKALVLLVALTACKKSATTSQAPEAPAIASAPAPTTQPIPAPLKNVATVYEVTYTPETVLLSEETAQHHLKSISGDGTTFTFDGDAKDVGALKTGSVMLLTGVALRKVTQVQQTGGQVVVTTDAADITDAIQDGHIQAKPMIDFGSVAMAPARSSDGWSLVPSAYADVIMAPLPRTFSVQIDPFSYSVKFTPAADRLNIEMTVSSTTDNLSFTATGYLKNYQTVIDMLVNNKTVSKLDFENSNVEGDMTVNWTAATVVAGPLSKISSWTDMLKKYQPLRQSAFTFPFAIGPIPFTLKFSTGITFTPAFTSKNSAMKGSMTIHYSGSGGFTVDKGQVAKTGAMSQPPGQPNPKTDILSLGPIGFTVAVEFPRAELGVGVSLVTFSPTAYINAISSFGLVYGGPAAMLPCETHILEVSINTGVSSTSTIASLFGTASKLSFAKQLYDSTYKGPGKPGVMMCPS